MGIREYGGLNPHEFGDVGVPSVLGYPDDLEMACPNCGCASLANLEVAISPTKPPLTLIRGVSGGGKIRGTYIGCPACPWASPMMMAPVPKGE